MDDITVSDDEARRSEGATSSGGRSLQSRLLFLVVGAVTVLIAYFLGSAVLPRWWAQRVSDVTDGRLIFGNMLGFVSGFVFTVLPLFVLAVGWRLKKSWKRALFFLVAAFMVATPNLLTLGIVLGNGDAAHAGERILDVDGPGFRGGSLVGAVAGVFCGAALLWLIGSRRRNKRKASDLKSELENRS